MSELPKNPNSGEEHKKSKKSSEKKYYIDWFQFTIALVVIMSFSFFVGIIIWGEENFDNSFKTIALIAPFVGTIIGFYFGQKPIQGLTQQVSEATTQKKLESQKALKGFTLAETDRSYIEQLEKQNEIKDEMIEDLKERMGL